jgi:uncharacterized protein (DUF885 family)
LKSFLFSVLALAAFVPALAAQKLTVDPQVAKAAQQPAVPVSLEDRRRALEAIFKEVWEERLERSPEFASSLGDKRWNAKLSDESVRAQNDWLAHEQNYLLRLASIAPTGLTDQEKLSRDLLIRMFSDDQDEADFKPWQMPVNQMGGIHTEFMTLAAQLSFKETKDYDDWIARLKQMPVVFDQVTTNMSLGLDDHRTPPRFLMEKALEQVKQLAAQKPEDSPLAAPLKQFPSSVPAAERERIQVEMLDVIAKQVLPAYQRFARFLEVTYIPGCRTEIGASALPDGADYYKFLLRRITTTALTAEQIHQIGLDQVAHDETEMLVIARKLGFTNLAAFRASLKTNPKLKGATREQLLDDYRVYLKPMQAKLPELFGRLPKAPFEVAAVPEFIEKTSAPAYYEPGSPDGSRPGRLRIDTYNAADRNLYAIESTAYHEGLPGHHLQISIAQELDGLPTFRKHEYFTAYTEGWGLYAERLGKEVGFYQDPYSDYGRLENDIWRAIRLVVDTGVHSQHWTRSQMVDYFHDHSAIDESSIQAEVDRYIAWPGQATAYKIGQLKILELRDRAQKALGPKFDLRAFHDQVLDSGALPLDLLSDRIDAWIAAQTTAVK